MKFRETSNPCSSGTLCATECRKSRAWHTQYNDVAEACCPAALGGRDAAWTWRQRLQAWGLESVVAASGPTNTWERGGRAAHLNGDLRHLDIIILLVTHLATLPHAASRALKQGEGSTVKIDVTAGTNPARRLALAGLKAQLDNFNFKLKPA
eukprot:2325448-Rhodomonas_salina.1